MKGLVFYKPLLDDYRRQYTLDSTKNQQLVILTKGKNPTGVHILTNVLVSLAYNGTVSAWNVVYQGEWDENSVVGDDVLNFIDFTTVIWDNRKDEPADLYSAWEAL